MTETGSAAPLAPTDIMASAPALSWTPPGGRGKGTIRMEWELGVNADGSRELAVLNVHHFTGQYVATINRTVARPASGGGFACETSHPLAALRLALQPVARCSRKTHLAFAQQVEETLAAGGYPAALAKFDASVSAF